MARTVKNTKSPEERRAEAEALQATIAEQVEALRESETWARFLTFAQSFHRYSLGNLLLIFAQCPEASHVAGYRTWQKLNRQVRKGERGIRIFGGRDVRETVENEQTGEEEEQRRVRFFRCPCSTWDRPTSSTRKRATRPTLRDSSPETTPRASSTPWPTTSPARAGPSSASRSPEARTGTPPPTARSAS